MIIIEYIIQNSIDPIDILRIMRDKHLAIFLNNENFNEKIFLIYFTNDKLDNNKNKKKLILKI